MKKVRVIGILSIIVLILSGCMNKQEETIYSELTIDSSGTSESYRAFFDIESCSEVETDLFRIKIDVSRRIINDKIDNDFFSYNIYLVPKTEEPLKVYDLIFLPTQVLKNYFSKTNIPNIGFRSLDAASQWTQDFVWTWTDRSDIVTYQVVQIVGNNGNEHVLDLGLSLDSFANLMKYFELQLNYERKGNRVTEIIPLYCEVLKTIRSETDLKEEDDLVIRAFMNHEAGGFIGPYQSR